MARWRNLRDPVLPDTNRRVRDIEAGSPIGFSSVERGGLRIASDQGLLIEGQGLVTGLFDVTGTLSGTGDFEWEGPLDISGDADFTGTVDARFFRVESDDGQWSTQINSTGMHIVKGASGQSQSFVYTLNSNGVNFIEGDVKMAALEEASSPTSMGLVLIDSDNRLWRGPNYSPGGSGGDPGGGGDNPKGLIYPYPLAQAGDRWGPRDGGGVGSDYHRGIDWPKAQGTAIPASGDGTVIMAQDTGDLWGNYVRIDHGDGVWTAYAHIMPGGFAVSVGQTVTRGQTIAYVGTTGPSTGPHLHFEVWVGGERVDPEWYIGTE